MGAPPSPLRYQNQSSQLALRREAEVPMPSGFPGFSILHSSFCLPFSIPPEKRLPPRSKESMLIAGVVLWETRNMEANLIQSEQIEQAILLIRKEQQSL